MSRLPRDSLRNDINVTEGLLRLGRSDIWSRLSTVCDELGEMPSLDELFDGNLELEKILGIVLMISVEPVVFILISFLGRAL